MSHCHFHTNSTGQSKSSGHNQHQYSGEVNSSYGNVGRAFAKLKYYLFAIAWVFASPLKFTCWNLSPKVMVLGGQAFGRQLGHEGGALVNEISALLRDPWELPCLFHRVRIQVEVCDPEEGPRATMLHLNLRLFQPPELWEINFYYL